MRLYECCSQEVGGSITHSPPWYTEPAAVRLKGNEQGLAPGSPTVRFTKCEMPSDCNERCRKTAAFCGLEIASAF